MQDAEGVIHLEDFDDAEDEDDSYVPDSLKGFLAQADKKLQEDLDDVMNFDYSKPKSVPSVGVDPPTEQDEEDKAFFHDILRNEKDTQLKQQLLQSLDEDDFMSPPLEPPASTNPAAFLTHGAAKEMALGGYTPSAGPVMNLQQQLDQVADPPRGTPSVIPCPLPSSANTHTPVSRRGLGQTPNTPKSMLGTNSESHTDTNANRMSAAVSQSPLNQSSSGPVTRSGGTPGSRLASYAGPRPEPQGLRADNLPSPKSTDVKSPELPPQRSTVVTQRPIGQKGLEPNPRLTTTVTEIHPNALRKSKALQEERENRRPPTTPNHNARTTPSSISPKGVGRASPATSHIPRENGQPMTPVARPTPQSQLERRDRQLVAETATAEDLSPQRPIEISFLPMDRSVPSPLPMNGVSSPLDVNALHMDGTPSDDLRYRSSPPTSSSPRMHSRVLQTTASSQGKLGTKFTSPTEPSPSTQWKGRKELTSPDKLSTRLLQGTTASRARFSKPQHAPAPTREKNSAQQTLKPVSSRLLKRTQAAEVYMANSPIKKMASPEERIKLDKEREQTKARVRARIELQKQKDMERKRALEERIDQRQKEQNEKRKKMQAALTRARQKREKLESMEQQRLETLKQKLKEKEAKVRQRLAEKENFRPPPKKDSKSITSHQSAVIHRKVTVPIAPTFRTEQRLKTRDRGQVQDPVSLANSDAILKQHLRTSTPETRDFAHRTLTIPRGPRLSTSKRHGEVTHQIEPKREHAWERELRHVSSPMASDRSASSRLTIPQTPKFHEIKARALPKSTAEKEAEEMEYFKSHPFKARPVKMNDTGSVTKPTDLPLARPLTAPSPFQFRTEQRLSSSTRRRDDLTPRRDDDDNSAKIELFKARPLPKFNKSTPLTGNRPTSLRAVTTPEPFHFQTDSRHAIKTPQEESSQTAEPMFKAKPMPNFSRPTGIILHRKTHRKSSVQLEPEESFQFKARPMPSFSKGGPPETIAWASTREKTLDDDEEEGVQFRARPMPSFDKVTIPVRLRDTVKARISPPNVISKENETELVSFRAQKLPDLSRVSIPVKPQDPSRLRSPDIAKIIQQNNNRGSSMSPIDTTEGFRARPLPKLSPPSIPVRPKDPSKLRSPDLHKDSKIRSPGAVIFHTRNSTNGRDPVATGTVYKATPALSSPKWEPPVNSPERKKAQNSVASKESSKLAAKERLRQRLKGRASMSASQPNGKKFSSASVKSRLDRIAPVASPEPMGRKESEVASSSNTVNVMSTGTWNNSTRREALCHDNIPDASEVIDVCHESRRMQVETLNVASQKLEATDYQGITPRAGTRTGQGNTMETHDPIRGQAAAEYERREKELEASQKINEAMKMAYDLQRAAEDELSFHGSMNSRDQQMGYEGGDFI